jgi:hypothetical protein
VAGTGAGLPSGSNPHASHNYVHRYGQTAFLRRKIVVAILRSAHEKRAQRLCPFFLTELKVTEAVPLLPDERHSVGANHARYHRSEHAGVGVESAYKRRPGRIGFAWSEKWRRDGVNGLAIPIRNQNHALR